MTPAKVAAIPRITLESVYSMKWYRSPSRRRARFSFANVENVVKPPQKPTARNSLHPALRRVPLSDNP
jgi:hypothetical protein